MVGLGLARFYRRPGASPAKEAQLLRDGNAKLAALGAPPLARVETELCYYVDFECAGGYDALSDEQKTALTWLLRETFEPENFAHESFLASAAAASAAAPSVVVEVGPRLSFTSAFSTNAVSIFRNCGIPARRVERFRRYRLSPAAGAGASAPSAAAAAAFAETVHDRMTEWVRPGGGPPLASFGGGAAPAPVRVVPLLAQGRPALAAVNAELGLSMDAWDLDFYTALFVDELRRDPTDVELFDISQSNSEHSRHWFFKGRMVLDGVAAPRTLMEVVGGTLAARAGNSVIAFADNSSAIEGFATTGIVASAPGAPGALAAAPLTRHCLLTAETHNFPTGVAPFPGAATGTGGRIRDTHATGRGSSVIAGTAAYCVGALRIPGHALPWEAEGAAGAFGYPDNLAAPLAIELAASDGASGYGNEFGEPIVAGFTRSVALRLPGGERREYIKPIMFTAGIGAIEAEHAVKASPAAGMLVVKLGGPAYRIGMGGSAASSMTQGENRAELDFNAVQRGDAEMAQKVNRVIRACVELGPANPIATIHDQGAGGNCNVLKEIVAPAGGVIRVRDILVGDASMSVLEIWGAEYQEADALLVAPEAAPLFARLCARERAPVAFVGAVDGSGRVRLVDAADGSTPVDMDLDKVLGAMPQKSFASERAPPRAARFALPAGVDLAAALERVLRLLAVGSKRFLTNKVDRAVTGLIAQQQCVGPLHTPLADVAVVALSLLDTVGVASSIGEQPLKGLVSPAALGRMSVAEAITNLAAARVRGGLAAVKCSANWMWAAKLPHEGAALYDAAVAMADFMLATGVAVDGGKDSLSMAARAPDGELVKAPGSLVISTYAACPDITLTVTPDFKPAAAASVLLLVDLSPAPAAPTAPRHRAGASALAQCYGAVGDLAQCPDADDAPRLVAAFDVLQALLAERALLALHDRSDGGVVVAALEMAFAGNCGLALELPAPAAGAAADAAGAGDAALSALFAAEVGWLAQVRAADAPAILARFAAAGVLAYAVGAPLAGEDAVRVAVGGAPQLPAGTRMTALRDAWESTSFALDALQAAPAAVAAERDGMAARRAPPYALTFAPAATAPALLLPPGAPGAPARPRVLVLREEGSNGDREMGAALMAAGFEAWDATVSDLAAGRLALGDPALAFRGLVFPGGFSYADVLDSAKGWAASIRFNAPLAAQFAAFYARADTFSLGVCNGCQLAALLGWVPFGPGGAYTRARDGARAVVAEAAQPRFIRNASERFESRFPAVRIADSPALMFRGMAGSVLGVWAQHGEGRLHFPDADVRAAALAARCVALTYVDDAGADTEAYPFNPNGSPGGIAGLCSPDGRHLAVMPHPERAHLLWQWPYLPPAWRDAALAASPWMRMFQNARAWCDEVPRAPDA